MIWVAIGLGVLVGLPFLWYLGGFTAKFLWGWWPGLAAMSGAGWMIWNVGIENLWLIGVFLLIAVLGVYLWQRLNIFIKVDRRLDKIFLLDD